MAVTVGVSDHGGWAVLVTASSDGELLDRRRVELVDDTLPAIPHHHEAQLLPMADAVALVERVRVSAELHAQSTLGALATAVPNIAGIALRICPPLPATITERITDYRSRNVADWVMYRQALALAADTRGWTAFWYDTKKVFESAREAICIDDFDAYFTRMRKKVGPPWNTDHKLALASAIAASNALARRMLLDRLRAQKASNKRMTWTREELYERGKDR